MKTTRTAAIVGTDDRQLLQIAADMGLRTVLVAFDEFAAFSAAPRQLDVAVVDVRVSGRLPEDIAGFRRRHAGTPIVLVTQALDPTLMLEAMRAGIGECVTEPVTAAALEAAIARVTVQKAAEPKGQLFAFVGAKGGVGATTVAVNVATALARTDARTLYVDLHVAYGDAAVFLGAEPRFSVVDALENIHRLDEALFKTLVTSTTSGVDLLASSTQGAARAADADRVRRLLDFALAHYRYVVVDCPRLDPQVIDALEAASKVVLVANQELATLRSGTRMIGMLRQRFRAERVMVVISRFDSTSEIGHDDVERVLGSTVRHVVPSDYRTSLEALNRGKPLVLKNHSRVASSIETLAGELGGYVRGPKTEPKSGGLLGRLTGKR